MRHCWILASYDNVSVETRMLEGRINLLLDNSDLVGSFGVEAVSEGSTRERGAKIDGKYDAILSFRERHD